MNCPVCSGPARNRQSRAITRTLRELRYACVDVDCGLTFRAELVITHAISPSARPDPTLHLPLWPVGRNANDNHGPAAATGR